MFLIPVKSKAQGTSETKVMPKAQFKGLSQLKVSGEVQGSNHGKVWLLAKAKSKKAQVREKKATVKSR